MRTIRIDPLEDNLSLRQRMVNLDTFDDAEIMIHIVDALEDPLQEMGIYIEYVYRNGRNHFRLRKIEEEET